MSDAPSESKHDTVPVSRAARWIVGSTIALWLIFCLVMTCISERSPDQDRSFWEMWFWLLASVPSILVLMLCNPTSDVGFWICAAISGMAFMGLEGVAWARRVKWLAWLLLALLVVNMVVMVVIIANTIPNTE